MTFVLIIIILVIIFGVVMGSLFHIPGASKIPPKPNKHKKYI